jgi:hypothetical protein
MDLLIQAASLVEELVLLVLVVAVVTRTVADIRASRSGRWAVPGITLGAVVLVR